MAELPELAALYRCAKRLKELGEVQELATLVYNDKSYPILSFHFGSKDPKAPTLVFVAGVHGLEKIGTQIVTAYLDSWIHLLTWDKTLEHALKHCRVLFYPLVNPVGMALNRRSNGQGVDLMRNAPLDAQGKTAPLVGGHRLSPHLPWFRGYGALEAEAEILCEFIRKHCFPASASLILDVHSGFGLRDRLWFPYASSHDYFPEASSVLAIKRLFDRTYPHHTYTVEPQHHAYTTHGDLWDYLYLQHQAEAQAGRFLPLCLEMGSWAWVKKNPKQLFSAFGLFNPVLPHRIKRAERRHFLLFNFLIKVIASTEGWCHMHPLRIEALEQTARRLWYRPG